MASYAGYMVVCSALAVDSDAGVALAVTRVPPTCIYESIVDPPTDGR